MFTFEQLLSPYLQGEASRKSGAIEKVKLRGLKVRVWSSSVEELLDKIETSVPLLSGKKPDLLYPFPLVSGPFPRR